MTTENPEEVTTTEWTDVDTTVVPETKEVEPESTTQEEKPTIDKILESMPEDERNKFITESKAYKGLQTALNKKESEIKKLATEASKASEYEKAEADRKAETEKAATREKGSQSVPLIGPIYWELWGRRQCRTAQTLLSVEQTYPTQVF